jgi:sucrose synthase
LFGDYRLAMIELIHAVVNSDERTDFQQFLIQLSRQNTQYLLRNEILSNFADYRTTRAELNASVQLPHLEKLIYFIQEIIISSESYCLVIRSRIAKQRMFRVIEDLTVEEVTTAEWLDICDRFVNRSNPQEGDILSLNVRPFYDYSPLIQDPKNIGKGVQFLNRYLSSKLFQDPQQWLTSLFQFLSLHHYNGFQLLINERIQSYQQLSECVKQALAFVGDRAEDTPYSDFRFDLQSMGFEPGWGNTAGRISETLSLLDSVMDSPDHQNLEELLSRIPIIFRIVLVSVHGWFGQEGVLGRPDTGGQVVYVLDQARSLEQQLQDDMRLAGLEGLGAQPQVLILSRLIPNSDGTRCDQRIEKVYGTQNTSILRVPFREFNPNVTNNWISRFEIWPYLETFAIDAERELLAELQGRPDLIIGNYSDGNLVAFLLSRRLKVTQCNIAHALEKSKYLFSNLYWQDLEEKYHFSLQFTTDLIAMNAANYIISSSYQEIVGTPDSIGQYESYKCFTMPELYHVVDGVELFSPKFNVVPPGVNESYFFPYLNKDDRLLAEITHLEDLLFTMDDPSQIYGQLDDPSKRPLFSMARLDRIKNLTGLAECFGQSAALQEQCNLIVIAGKLRVEDTTDAEEASEIERLYSIIHQYNLYGKVRWLGIHLSKANAGEIYRIIGDRQGIFVQPALFEAFGLTILESMITGLPTFATQFGGPREIIQDGVNGFYINPTKLEDTADKLLKFVLRCNNEPEYWATISKQAIARVYSAYTWKIHANKLLSLARIYGFWNYTARETREDLLTYLESLFHLLYKPRAQHLLSQHMER